MSDYLAPMTEYKRNFRTTFGAIPVNVSFDCWIRERDPHDRRRKLNRRATFIKATHGTIAGFATNDRRFGHSTMIYIDASDLRLLVDCVRSIHHNG